MKIKENLHAYAYLDKFILHNVLRSSWIVISKKELELILLQKYTELSETTQKKINMFQLFLDQPLNIERSEITIPQTVYLVLTHQCNLTCVYCYAEAEMTKNYTNPLTFVEWFHTLNQLKDCGVKNVIFTGGEIGLNDDSLKYIDYAHQIGLSVGLITNGTLLGKKSNAQFLATRCQSITISLDSIDKEENDKNRGRGCYEIAMRAIKHLLAIGYKNISVNTTVTSNNLESIDNTIEFFKKNNISFKLGGFSELGRGSKAAISLTFEERVCIECKEKDEQRSSYLKPFTMKESCGLGIGEFAINPLGDVYACKLLESEDYKLGNIRQQTLQEIYQQKNTRFLETQNIHHLTEYQKCSFRYLCGGGCRANHYYHTNDFKGVDPSECRLLKELIKNQMYRLWQEKE
ncbi:radical SAM protein [Enterococcus villorum]|uniref:radical SAM protein n=1 Tax=Enterococcus villorum TaxID=112904 RepID=UPI003F8C58F2